MAVIPLPSEVRMAWESAGSREEGAKPSPREIFPARKARGRGGPGSRTGETPRRGWARRERPRGSGRGGRGRAGQVGGAGRGRAAVGGGSGPEPRAGGSRVRARRGGPPGDSGPDAGAGPHLEQAGRRRRRRRWPSRAAAAPPPPALGRRRGGRRERLKGPERPREGRALGSGCGGGRGGEAGGVS